MSQDNQQPETTHNLQDVLSMFGQGGFQPQVAEPPLESDPQPIKVDIPPMSTQPPVMSNIMPTTPQPIQPVQWQVMQQNQPIIPASPPQMVQPVQPQATNIATFDRDALLAKLRAGTKNQIDTVVSKIARVQVVQKGRTSDTELASMFDEHIINSVTREILAKPGETFNAQLIYWHTEYMQMWPYNMRESKKTFVKEKSLLPESKLAQKIRNYINKETFIDENRQTIELSNTETQVYTLLVNGSPILMSTVPGRLTYHRDVLMPQIKAALAKFDCSFAQLIFTIGTTWEKRYETKAHAAFLTWEVKNILFNPETSVDSLKLSEQTMQQFEALQERERREGVVDISEAYDFQADDAASF